MKSRSLMAIGTALAFVLALSIAALALSTAVLAASSGTPTPSPVPKAAQYVALQSGLSIVRALDLRTIAQAATYNAFPPRGPGFCRGQNASYETSNNVMTSTVDAYYDGMCSRRWHHFVSRISAPDTVRQTATSSFTATDLVTDRRDQTVTYDMFRATLSNTLGATLSGGFNGAITTVVTRSAVVLAATEAPAPNAAPFDIMGVACGRTDRTPEACDITDVVNTRGLGQSFGFAAHFAWPQYYAANPSTQGNVTEASGSVTVTSGALGTVNLSPGSAPGSIVGGVPYGTLSVTFARKSDTYTTGRVFTCVDNAHDISASISLGSAGFGFAQVRVLEGTIRRTSSAATLATFSIDASGSGTIEYTDGSTGTITGYTIQS